MRRSPPPVPTTSSLAVYFAACFKRREELIDHAAELESHGITVTSRWLRGSRKLQRDELLTSVRGASLASMDFEDVRSADVCIAFTEPDDAMDRGRGGRHTEFGIALGLGRPVAVVGPIEHVFHRLPGVVHHPEWKPALSWLTDLAAPLRAAA